MDLYKNRKPQMQNIIIFVYLQNKHQVKPTRSSYFQSDNTQQIEDTVYYFHLRLLQNTL